MDWIKAIFFFVVATVIFGFGLLVAFGIWVIVHGYDSSAGLDSLSPWYEPDRAPPRVLSPPTAPTHVVPARAPSRPSRAPQRAGRTGGCRPVTCSGPACYHNLDVGCR